MSWQFDNFEAWAFPGPGNSRPPCRPVFRRLKKTQMKLDFLWFSLHFDAAPLASRARFRQTVKQIFSNASDVLSFSATLFMFTTNGLSFFDVFAICETAKTATLYRRLIEFHGF